MKPFRSLGENITFPIVIDDYMKDFFDPNKIEDVRPKLFHGLQPGDYHQLPGPDFEMINVEDDFKYTINKDIYRSKLFEKMDPTKTNILYSGCSVTWGTGIPDEYIWPNLTTELLKDQYNNISAYNLSFPGWSIDIIIKNIMSFIRMYGKPDHILIEFPDINRGVIYSEEDNKYILIHPVVDWLDSRMSKTQKKFSNSYDWQNNLYKYVELIRMLEDYCEEAGINLIWTTWQLQMIKEYSKINFKYFMPVDDTMYLWHESGDVKALPQDNFPKNVNNLPYWYIARDANHPGTCWTTTTAKYFYDKMVERKNEKTAV